jgi:hypothetical protein
LAHSVGPTISGGDRRSTRRRRSRCHAQIARPGDGQGAEIEAVLGLIVQHLDPSADVERRSAGQLLKKIPGLLQAHASATSQADLDLIKQAIERRNHAVHSAVMIGSSWMPYSTGRGEWTPVISLMRDGEYTEPDLLDDLALQQEATAAAVGILRSLDEPDN